MLLPASLPPGLLTVGQGKLFELHPTMLLSESWTNNFNQTATNRQEDWRTVFGPGGNLLINGPATKGVVSGNAGLTYDTAPSTGFNVFPTGTGVLQQTLSPRLNLTFADTFTRNNNPNQADIFGLNTQRQTFTSNAFNAAVNYQMDMVATQAYYFNSLFFEGGTNGVNTVSNIFGVSASTQIGLYNTAQVGYQYSRTDTSGTSSGSNSGLTTGNLFTASLSHQTGQYSSVGVSGSYQTMSFPQSNGQQPQSNDEQIWNVSLLAAYGLASGLSLSGSIGYGQLRQSNQSPESLVTTNTSLSYRFAQAAVSVGFFSDFRQTALQGQNFGVVQTQGYTGSFLYNFTPLISGSIQATYFQNTFTGTGNSSSTPNSNNLYANANLNWQALPWLIVSGQYSYLLRSGTTGSLSGPGSIPVNTVTLSLYGTF